MALHRSNLCVSCVCLWFWQAVRSWGVPQGIQCSRWGGQVYVCSNALLFLLASFVWAKMGSGGISRMHCSSLASRPEDLDRAAAYPQLQRCSPAPLTSEIPTVPRELPCFPSLLYIVSLLFVVPNMVLCRRDHCVGFMWWVVLGSPFEPDRHLWHWEYWLLV